MSQKIIQPKFIYFYSFLKNLIPFFFIFSIFLMSLGLNFTLTMLFVLFSYLFAVFLHGKSYAHTHYEIHSTYISYTLDFIVHSKKEIRFNNVKEVRFLQGPLQRHFGLGNIQLLTNANDEKVALDIRDIEKVEDVYHALRKIINVNEGCEVEV